jgi:hypothetical protein
LSRPAKFLIRLALIGAPLLWLVSTESAPLVKVLLPAMGAEITAIDDNVSILQLDVVRDGSKSRIRMRADLLRPTYINGYRVVPLASTSSSGGWYQVNLNASAALKSTFILLVVVLSWPAGDRREWIKRVLIAIPLLLLLFAADAPLDLLGNLQDGIAREFDPKGIRPLFTWSTFLEGGGNSVLALALSGVAIALAMRGATGGEGVDARSRAT